jgi:hypothetical protein
MWCPQVWFDAIFRRRCVRRTGVAGAAAPVSVIGADSRRAPPLAVGWRVRRQLGLRLVWNDHDFAVGIRFELTVGVDDLI